MEYTTRELTAEEGEALNKDMLEVMEKHGTEMSVVSSIHLLKRVETIPEPFTVQPNGDSTTEEDKTD